MGDRRVALITGGCSGIGLACAQALAREGCSVGILDRRAPDVAALTRELIDLGASGAHIVEGDLATVGEHVAKLDEVQFVLGPIDILVNNAGVPAQRRGDLLHVTPEAFDATVGVNLRGTFFLTQAVARRMVERADAEGVAGRAIITVSSISATMASIERAEYCLSKSALPMLVKLFALRLAPHGIGVFEVRPGIIRTPMTAGVAPRYDALIGNGLVPAGRWGEAEDVARAVCALTDPGLAFATGTVVFADGGLTIERL
jgi:NAD(P)-dependent dehydrogenase (short-subunit alcohol dehydrogenase family)